MSPKRPYRQAHRSDGLPHQERFWSAQDGAGIGKAGPEPQSQRIAAQAPPAIGGRITIQVGLYVLNLVALDEVQQTFTFIGYLWLRFRGASSGFHRVT